MSSERSFYFSRYEDRRPPPPLSSSPLIESLWQYFAVMSLALGAWYIGWRWTASLNFDVLWFSLPMVLAETCAYFGMILFTYNLWAVQDYPRRPPPLAIGDCTADLLEDERRVSVDIFITTYNEDEELVRLSIRDALAVRYPGPIDVKVHVLDDGGRPAMAAVAAEEGANYITRSDNAGFKAGNIRNAMEQTTGDFIVICDADTRLFPTMLENTLGYFRDPDVAFVQTPQWFYDLPEGVTLSEALERRLGRFGRWIGRAVERMIGELRVGQDPFVNDPQMFYDVIQRRRNRVNAAFCCGASSVHRREAVMAVALRAFADAVAKAAKERRTLRIPGRRKSAPNPLAMWQAAQAQELTPYKFHVSEDIYTTIVLQRDEQRRWKSVLHPDVESKMLSPQDLLTWYIQRFKYAGGSLDILFHDNPVTGPGLSLGQRLMYLSTFWSYLGALWNVIFLVAPVIYFTTGLAPVAGYTDVFFIHAIPFLVAGEVATIFGLWGLAGYKSKITFLASFPLSLQALWAVMRNQKIKFHVTPKVRQDGSFLVLVWPQILTIVITAAAFAFAMVQLARGTAGYSAGGLLANGLWGLNNIIAMSVMVRAALWSPDRDEEERS